MTPSTANELLAVALARPEFAAVKSVARVELAPLPPPRLCQVAMGRISLTPQLCTDSGLLPLLHLLLELALWHRLVGEAIPLGGRLLAAAHATACVPSLLPRSEAENGWSNPPPWLARLMEEATSGHPSPDLAEILSHAGSMLGDDAAPAAMETLWRAFETLRPVAVPVAGLMLRDSDSRIDLSHRSGRNRYGSGALPRPGLIALSSSTANTVSPQGLRRAEMLRRRFLAAAAGGKLSDDIRAAADGIRHDILSQFGLSGMTGIKAVLASSGTTATLLATHFITHRGGTTLALVLGPEESGSGIPLVAGGRHPAPRTPRGAAVAEGAPVDGVAPEGLTVEGMAFRDDGGSPLPPAIMEDRIGRRIASAQAEGRRVVLHVLEGSKTGETTPGLVAVAALLRRFPRDLAVIADCCQMRNGFEVLRRYLEIGCLVSATGSKFFAGPAFCGILLLPPDQEATPIAPGLGDYSWRSDWPQGWGQSLPEGENPGLLLRWQAALGEMRAFRRLPEAAVTEALRQIAQAVAEVMAEAEDMVLLPGASPSIATIAIRNGTGWLNREALQRIYELLGEDLPGDATPALAARLCSIGQPVTLAGGPIMAGLRLAFSSRHVVALASGHARRLTALRSDIRIVLDKIRLIRQFYPLT